MGIYSTSIGSGSPILALRKLSNSLLGLNLPIPISNPPLLLSVRPCDVELISKSYNMFNVMWYIGFTPFIFEM